MSLAARQKLAAELALDIAIGCHANGDLLRARDVYRKVLAEDSANALALHYLGIYFFQTDRPDEAISHLRLSCTLEPDNAAWHNDFGNVLFALEFFEQAVQCYEAALKLTSLDANVWNNLGSALLKTGDRAAAIDAFGRAIAIMPEFGAALTNLGAVYEEMGLRYESSLYQCRAFVLPPYEGKSKQMLGVCFYFLGRLAEAAEAYRCWLEEEPGHPIATHMVAACTQAHIPARASDGYIEKHFDSLAQNFDVNLIQNLDYGGPWLVSQAMTTIAPPARQFAILDIGCGTGLCGPSLAAHANHLAGVDLSGKMLEKAAQGGLYDILEKQEITHYLDTCATTFDIVAACDTLIYFGELERLFGAVARVLKPGGYFIFTTESIDDPERSARYALHASGRYRHADVYIDEVLRDSGFMLSHRRAEKIRDEIGSKVDGTLVVLRRI